MGTPITFNGASYTVPALNDTGWAQGSGNLSSYLVAIASGSLQTTGGTFTLSADANFGSSFGLLASYYKSASASIATSGVIRLAIGDTIDWGTGNLALSVSGTTISWNGAPLLTGTAGTLAISGGGTGQTTAAAAITALTGSQTSGFYLRSNGTNAALAAIVAGDVPTLNQNTTGTAGNVSGTVAVANGGTGDTSLTAYSVMCGGTTSTGAVQSVASVGTSGQVLTSNGAAALPTFQSLPGAAAVRTRQVFLSGTAATYTTPANCRQLLIRMVGGGGGGGSNGSGSSGATDGGNGGNSSFNSIVANGGAGGKNAQGNTAATAGGAGGSSGTGSASFRIPGTNGGLISGANSVNPFGVGGNSAFFCGGGASSDTTGLAGATNSGGGGSGGGSAGTSLRSGAGGGGGESLELLINTPSATYTYTVGAGGTAGTNASGANPENGGAGAAGIIIVDEFY